MSREIVKGERFQEVLCYVFLISLSEMLLISAGVFSKQLLKKKVRHLTSLAHDELENEYENELFGFD